MKLTRLAAAPGRMRQGAAAWPRRRGCAATASQLIAGVRQTREGEGNMRARMIVLALLISSGVAPSAKPKGDAARELVGAWAAAVNSGKGLEAMDRLFAA